MVPTPIPLLCGLLAVAALCLAQTPPPKPPAPPPAPPEAPKPGSGGAGLAPIALKVDKLQRIAPDGVALTADYHALPYDDGARPLFVCFHMEQGSRGEFVKIAQRFGDFACSTLAVDLRSGKASDGIANETAASAATVLKKSEFTNEEALADVLEALRWAREMHPSGKIFALGSGTSAALVVLAAAREPANVDALFLFSPAEDVPGTSVGMEAKKIVAPTYVTCDGTPQESGKARMIGNAIDKKLRHMVIPTGVEGATRGAKVLVQPSETLRDRHWSMMVKLILELSPPAGAPAPEPPKQG